MFFTFSKEKITERKNLQEKLLSIENLLNRKSAQTNSFQKKIFSKENLHQRKSSRKKIFLKENLLERKSSRKKSWGYFIKPTVDDLSVLLLPTISSLLSGNQPCLVTTSLRQQLGGTVGTALKKDHNFFTKMRYKFHTPVFGVL